MRQLFYTVQTHVAVIGAICAPAINVFASAQSLDRERYQGFQHVFKYIPSWRDFGFEATPGDGALSVPSDILRGRTDSVYLVVWSPDGETVATCSSDGTATLWDAASGRVLHVLHAHCSETPLVRTEPSEKSVHSLAWSLDGTTITTRSGTTNPAAVVCVKLWNVVTGSPLPVMDGPMHHTQSKAWSPDGQIIATKGNDGTVRLWGATGRELIVLRGHTARIRSLAWKPDGTSLATGATDVRLWSIDTGMVQFVLSGHTHWVCSLAFTPAGTTLATGSQDETVRLWDTATGKLVHVLYGHTAAVNHVAWSPDGSVVATASDDHTARLGYPTIQEKKFIPRTNSSVWYFEPQNSQSSQGYQDSEESFPRLE